MFCTMAPPQKKHITEPEKLKIQNCIGRQYIVSCHVTPNFELDNVRTPNVETTASVSAVPHSLITYFDAYTNDDNDGLSLDEEPDDTLVADVVLPEQEDEVAQRLGAGLGHSYVS